MGDVRYVTPEIYRTFATDRSEDVRAQALQNYVEFLSAHAGHVHSLLVPVDDAARKKWLDDHPLGYFEYRDAFAPDGKYGRWIRRHQAIVQIGDGLFVHGGLNPALPFESAAALDVKIHAELEGFDELWQALSRAKVVWRYMTLSEALAQVEEEQKWMQAQATPADPVIAGHIQKLLGYRQWMVDLGGRTAVVSRSDQGNGTGGGGRTRRAAREVRRALHGRRAHGPGEGDRDGVDGQPGDRH